MPSLKQLTRDHCTRCSSQQFFVASVCQECGTPLTHPVTNRTAEFNVTLKAKKAKKFRARSKATIASLDYVLTRGR